MRYAIEMALDDKISTGSFVKIGRGIQLILRLILPQFQRL